MEKFYIEQMQRLVTMTSAAAGLWQTNSKNTKREKWHTHRQGHRHRQNVKRCKMSPLKTGSHD